MNGMVLLVPLAEFSYWKQLGLTDSVTVLAVESTTAGELAFSTDGKARHALRHLKQPILGFAYTQTKHHALLAPVKDALKASGHVGDVPLIHCPPAKGKTAETADTTAIYQQLIGSLASHFQPVAAYNASLASALAVTRKAYQDVQQRFAAVEDFLNQHCGNHLIKLRTELPVMRDEEEVPLVFSFQKGKLSQTLPVSSTGICAIDLFVVHDKNSQIPHFMRVALYVGDAKTATATWTVASTPRSDKQGEWVSLALLSALDGLPQAVRLELSLIGSKTTSLGLGLAQAQAFDAYCLATAESITSEATDKAKPSTSKASAKTATATKPAAAAKRGKKDEVSKAVAPSTSTQATPAVSPATVSQDKWAYGENPLAIRVWNAIRGVKTPLSPQMILPDDASGMKIHSYSASGMLQQARAISDTRWAEGWNPVDYVWDRNELSIHPPSEGKITGAVIDGLFPPIATSLTARVLVANDKSNVVSFAFVIGDLTPREIDMMLTSNKKMPDNFIWSGWQDVAGHEERVITILYPPSQELTAADEALPVYLFTRMAQDRSNDWAWARIKELVIECAR
jgi:hypothetical protein